MVIVVSIIANAAAASSDWARGNPAMKGGHRAMARSGCRCRNRTEYKWLKLAIMSAIIPNDENCYISMRGLTTATPERG